ncbi:hypothetical protein CQA49_03665 [Helicobacter sp. MIT 00-7814]|uniref:hypothetical protein n=1 Tax=unclassified Helicobacter TaxID=2593540 RepID=UPI000E1F6B57|nr:MULTISPECIES: hypothetical protein [unclassified Helicobacter]RDU53041.1 hypothetical protein CQA37_07615 [Helicobacter sp. MIT 99-10781]RDU55316.1 hypothetical protein CQA49_03665 [Helicobacter sp. MIT 00-7814]
MGGLAFCRQILRICGIFCILSCGVFGNPLDSLQYEESLDGAVVEAVISYKFVLKDSLPTNERYRVSHALQPTKNAQIAYECEIDVSDYDISDDFSFFVIALLREEKEQVLQCLQKGAIGVKEYGLSRESTATQHTLLEIKPTRVLASLHNRALLLKVLKR